MTQMVRKQTQIQLCQEALLKRLAEDEGVSEAEAEPPGHRPRGGGLGGMQTRPDGQAWEEADRRRRRCTPAAPWPSRKRTWVRKISTRSA